MDGDETNNGAKADDGDDGDDGQGLWLSSKKRPNKGRSHTHGRSIHLNEHIGISKQVIPANQLKNPKWDSKLGQWVEGIPPPGYEKESNKNPFTSTSHIRGLVGDNFMRSRMESQYNITPWRKVYVGPPNKSRPYSRRPSHLRPLGQGGRRTHKHKRKNKHTRRRRVQRRRA